MVVGSILANLVIDLWLAAVEYRSLEAFYPTRDLNPYEILGPLSGHLWFAVQQTVFFWTLIIVVGYVLARRGRRWLFAGPALALILTPALVSIIQGFGPPAAPAFGTYGWLSQELAVWVSWVVSGIRTFLFLLPGLVARPYAERERNPFRVPALILVGIPALVAGYLGVLVVSPTGRIQDSPVELFIAAFFFGAAMGFDRPIWPWLLVAVPGLMEGLPSLLFSGYANEVLVVGFIAILGASSVPFSRILYAGWQENNAPGSPQGADSPTG